MAILKWIGILFGAILGLCLFLIVLAVFVPVRYRIWGSRQEKMVYCFKFSWLCSLLSVKKKKHSDRILLCVLGIPVRCLAGGEKKRADKKLSEKIGTDEPEKAEDGGAEPVQSEVKEKTEASPEKKPERKKRGKKRSGRGRKEKRAKTKKNFSFRKVSSIIKSVRQNGDAVKRLFGEVKELIRYLSPTKVRGEMVLGTGDPASTGLVFGGLSLFPVFYQEGVKITPDFEEKRFEAEGYMKGRLRVIYFLRLMFRLYKDRELKRLWKQFNQVKKEAA